MPGQRIPICSQPDVSLSTTCSSASWPSATCVAFNAIWQPVRTRNITPRIARKGIEPSQRLGRYRWTVERTVAWLSGCRRLHRRYERKAEHFLAFAGIAATLICYRRLGW